MRSKTKLRKLRIWKNRDISSADTFLYRVQGSIRKMTVGILSKDKIIVHNQADGNTIYNKGYFGTPLSGGGIELDYYESLYLQATDRLEIRYQDGATITKEEMMKEALRGDPNIAVKYHVYRNMRSRGYILKTSSKPADFRVFPRGGGPGKTPSRYWLIARAETDSFSIEDIEEASIRLLQIKKSLLVGLLDEEGDVTYYEIMTAVLTGDGNDIEDYEKLEGTVFGDKCYVKEGGNKLHEFGFYGRKSDDELQLSMVETLYLLEKNVLNVHQGSSGELIDEMGLKEYADSIQNDFMLRYKVYKNLRERNLIPKTGFKYGTAYRCYLGEPEEHHADYMIQPVVGDYTCSWYDISRAVRVAHTVRKEFMFARNLPDQSVSYIRIKRETP